MASIVLSAMRRLLLAALGFPALLAPGRLAAGPGAVALARSQRQQMANGRPQRRQ